MPRLLPSGEDLVSCGCKVADAYCMMQRMAAKKKSSQPKQTWTPPKGMPQLKPAGKPTEAITAKGQKGKDLGKSTKDNRFASNAKTPVKKAGSGFVGSGGTLSSGFKNITKGDMLNAALAVTSLPGSGQVKSAITKAVGKKVAGWSAKGATPVAYRGLSASGAGGKVSRTVTPFGPTLRSTAIGTKAQQAGRMAGLSRRAENVVTGTASRSASLAMRSTVKTINKAGKVGRDAAQIYVGSKTMNKKKNKNVK